MTVCDLRGTSGDTIRVYDRSAVRILLEGPPTVVVGTATCMAGLVHSAAVRLGMSASEAAAALGIDLESCLHFTDGGTGLVAHILRPRDVLMVSGGARGTTILIRDVGVVLVRESPNDVRDAISAWQDKVANAA